MGLHGMDLIRKNQNSLPRPDDVGFFVNRDAAFPVGNHNKFKGPVQMRRKRQPVSLAELQIIRVQRMCQLVKHSASPKTANSDMLIITDSGGLVKAFS